jgi:hypothetical protein
MQTTHRRLGGRYSVRQRGELPTGEQVIVLAWMLVAQVSSEILPLSQFQFMLAPSQLPGCSRAPDRD